MILKYVNYININNIYVTIQLNYKINFIGSFL